MEKGDKRLEFICDSLRELFSPETVIVFGEKMTAEGEVADFDVCVVAVFAESRRAALRRAYLSIESDIPFDVYLYSPEEWKKQTADPASFAARALRRGRVYYERKA